MLEAEQLQNTTDLLDVPAPEEEELDDYHLPATREDWLSPLLMQLRHQSEQVGRLEMQVRQLRAERDQLAIERDQLLFEQDDLHESEPVPEANPEGFQITLESVIGVLSQLKTAEGAVVTGIAIAIGLWLGVGLFAFVLLG